MPVSFPAGVIRLDEAARQWLGVPFAHQGRTEWALDCVGLLVMAARGAGIPIQDRTDYPPAPNADALDQRLQEQLGEPVSKDGIRPGDIVTIKFNWQPRHVGIVGEHDGRLTLIHTSFGVGRVTEHAINDAWLRRIHRVYRVSHE
ncbi:NlpC/P60 family protein [Pseudoxanthomonas sp. PXM05]|uniref:C40 family peptidase n=1 Tax=Pseudoxanthomonas sp. PXM05 TaxID=2854775 RepID=UPI001C491486|nr:C40 family peptidase [Pseudoxanthomonas sp. PXM05]